VTARATHSVARSSVYHTHSYRRTPAQGGARRLTRARAQVGVGLGWGFGAAYGANYLRIAPSFAEPRGGARGNPLAALQQLLRRLTGQQSSAAFGRAAGEGGPPAVASDLALKQR